MRAALFFLTKSKKREKKTWACGFSVAFAVDEDEGEGEGSLRLLEIPARSSDDTNGNR